MMDEDHIDHRKSLGSEPSLNMYIYLLILFSDYIIYLYVPPDIGSNTKRASL